jgi:hypothetical protein
MFAGSRDGIYNFVVVNLTLSAVSGEGEIIQYTDAFRHSSADNRKPAHFCVAHSLDSSIHIVTWLTFLQVMSHSVLHSCFRRPTIAGSESDADVAVRNDPDQLVIVNHGKDPQSFFHISSAATPDPCPNRSIAVLVKICFVLS